MVLPNAALQWWRARRGRCATEMESRNPLQAVCSASVSYSSFAEKRCDVEIYRMMLAICGHNIQLIVSATVGCA